MCCEENSHTGHFMHKLAELEDLSEYRLSAICGMSSKPEAIARHQE
jgi:hypothetical protein